MTIPDRNSIEYRRHTLKEKVVLLKAALLDVENFVRRAKTVQQISDYVESTIAEELNDPSPADEKTIYELRTRILKNTPRS
jgi:hypothetical protein